MHKYAIPLRAEYMERSRNPSQDSIFISDVSFLNSLYTVSYILPSDYAVIILISYLKIAKGRMLCPLYNRIRNSGKYREIHIRNPHRYHIKAFSYLNRILSFQKHWNQVYSQRIFSFSVNYRDKIILHSIATPVYSSSLPSFSASSSSEIVIIWRFLAISSFSRYSS